MTASRYSDKDIWEAWYEAQQEVADMKIYNGSDDYLFQDDPIPDPIPRRRRPCLPDWALRWLVAAVAVALAAASAAALTVAALSFFAVAI